MFCFSFNQHLPSMIVHLRKACAFGLRHWMTNSTGQEFKARHLLRILGLLLTTPLVVLLDIMFTLRHLILESLMTRHVLRVQPSLQPNKSAYSFGITCMVLTLTLWMCTLRSTNNLDHLCILEVAHRETNGSMQLCLWLSLLNSR